MIDVYYIILVIPAFLLALYAEIKVKSTFKKYSEYNNSNYITGAQAARNILDSKGLYYVQIRPVSGNLTDYYDPRNRTLNLSESVYNSTSLSAVGVAAHESGHAVQHKEGYAPMKLRSSLVPAANIGSGVGPYMAIFGIIFSIPFLTKLGIILFTAAVAFYLITLPVEIDASRRAVKILQSECILNSNEIVPVKKVLTAAAMTYVASAAVAMANLLRLVLLARDNRN